MKSTTINRRQALVGVTGVGLGAFIPSASAQQTPYPPKDFGGIHGDMLHRISEKLAGVAINTEQGLTKVVELLREWEIIDPADQEKLDELIKAIFNSTDPEALAKKIEKIYKESVDEAGEVSAAVISIARNSVHWAMEKFKEHPRVVYIVASDVTGALTGATIGRKLGTKFAAVGALAGAIGASAKAAFENQKS